MNIEAGIGTDTAGYQELGRQRPARRRIVIAAVVAALLVVAGAIALMRRHKAPAPVVETAPRVTVVVPGRHAVTAEIPAVGNIAAIRDMGVGIAGEGGAVTRVLVEPGDWVRAGQVLATVDRSVQAQQAASLGAAIAQAKADAALARSQLDRAGKLVGNGFISRADVETKQAAYDSAVARQHVAEAQLRQQQAVLGRLDIRAPTAGRVLTRAVEAGQVVGSASGALFHVAADGAMELQARLSEADLARLRVGAPAFVTPVGTTLKIPGRIWQISPVIDAASRQGTVRIRLPVNDALRPGGFAAAEIGGGAGEVPVLPESAVMSDARGNFVYLVGADGRVLRRDVKVGDVSDQGVTVLSGLSGTERVVAAAGAFLNAGDKVQPELQAQR